MCLVLTNPVEILAAQLVKQGIEAGGFCTSFKLLFTSFKPIHSRFAVQKVGAATEYGAKR